MGACRGQNRATRETPRKEHSKIDSGRVELVQRPCGRRIPDPAEKQQELLMGEGAS